nr:spore germination protein [uncultured Bacillus sp.]
MWKKSKSIKNVEDTRNWLVQRFESSFDLVHKEIQVEDREAILIYIKTVVDGEQLHKDIIVPFLNYPRRSI